MQKKFADQLLEKVRADYDRIAADFSTTRVALWPELRRFKGFVKPGDRVLDIGCGNGRVYQLFNGLAIEYEGIDVSEKLLAYAKDQWRDPLANFRVGSMLQIPFEDGSFDVALAVAVLHHVPSREYRLAALKEAWRVLKPGGVLLMTNWARWKPKHWAAHVGNAVQSLLGLRPYDIGDVLIPWQRGEKAERYVHAFTRGELGRLCRQAGFDDMQSSYVAAGVDTTFWQGDNIVTIARKVSGS